MTSQKSSEKAKCKCPYCDEELKLSCMEPPFCVPCKIEFTICEKCGEPMAKSKTGAHRCKADK